MAILAWTIIFLMTRQAMLDCTSNYSTPEVSSLCTFHFHNDSNCQSSSFSHCLYYLDCNTDNCTETNIQNETIFNKCLQICCDYLQVQDLQTYILLNCSRTSDTSKLQKVGSDSEGINSKYIVIIIILVVATTFLVIFIVKRCMDCYRLSRQQVDNIGTIASERGLVASNMPEQPTLQKEWYINQTRFSKDGAVSENCSICLSTHPHCLTDCNHLFHKRCIWEWLKVKMDCPLCKSININTLTIYCNNCYGNVYKCNSGQLTQSFDSVDYCMNCR